MAFVVSDRSRSSNVRKVCRSRKIQFESAFMLVSSHYFASLNKSHDSEILSPPHTNLPYARLCGVFKTVLKCADWNPTIESELGL